jgi:hypothetical protein
MGQGALRGIGRSLALGMGAAGFAACALASGPAGGMAVAQLDPQLVAPKGPPPARLEVNATSLPQLDSEASFTAPRVDMTLLPNRPSAVGVAVGLSGMQPQQAGVLPAFQPPQQAAMDLGVTVRHTFDNNQRVDVTAWRRMAQQQPDAMTLIQRQDAAYGARVEWNLSSAPRAGLVADKGFLGMQLEGGGRISVRRKNGGPMIYYRNKF